MEFLIIVDIFFIFILELEIFCQERFQKLSLLTNWIFCNRVIYVCNKLPNQIKKQLECKKKKLSLDSLKNYGKKRI